TCTSGATSRRPCAIGSRAGSGRPTSSRWARASGPRRGSPAARPGSTATPRVARLEGWVPGRPGTLGLGAPEEGIGVSAEAGIDAIRAKGIALTEYAIALHDAWLAARGGARGTYRALAP